MFTLDDKRVRQTSNSLTIADYPWDPIEINCQKCGRNGRFRKAALIEKYGRDTELPDLLALVASDCEFSIKLGNQGCGALYPALVRARSGNTPWSSASFGSFS